MTKAKAKEKHEDSKIFVVETVKDVGGFFVHDTRTGKAQGHFADKKSAQEHADILNSGMEAAEEHADSSSE